jgi:LacI family transcriptional regulator
VDIIATITIKDIAKKANVSVATVSRVINNSDKVKDGTREVVLQAMEELNYIPSDVARSLSKKETNTIGVVVPDINNPFFGQVIKGISSIADKEDLYMLLCDTDENEQKELKFLEMLKRQRIRGLIITPTMDNDKFNPEYVSALSKLDVPIVLLDRDIKYSNYDGVFLDNINGAYEAVNCLINEGHKKIAIISGPISSKPGRDRLRGYKKALAMNGIEANDSYIFYGDFKIDSGYKLTKQILKMENPPTAIFVSNNMMNLGCVKALNELNLNVPEDIGLIGFDEVETFEIMGINVSVIARPMAKMGETAMRILLERLNDMNSKEHQAKRVMLYPKLKLKGSEKKLK